MHALCPPPTVKVVRRRQRGHPPTDAEIVCLEDRWALEFAFLIFPKPTLPAGFLSASFFYSFLVVDEAMWTAVLF